MKCNICKAELQPNHYYTFTKTFWSSEDAEPIYKEARAIKVCDICEEELMRMYRELREDIAEHLD